MKKLFFIATIIFVFGVSFALSNHSFAQGMMGNIAGTNNKALQNDDGHTAREEAEGKIVWEQLQAKQTACKDLSNDNFGTLGEYFMGQMMGTSHEAMNNMMIQMMGEKNEEQMHIAMGKRMSACEPNVPMPQNMMSMMMGGMMGGGSKSSAFTNYSNNPMMNFGFMSFGWIFMILWWVLIVFGIIALVKWLSGKSCSSHNHKNTPLDILKERYAKGEISREELEKMKKDLA